MKAQYKDFVSKSVNYLLERMLLDRWKLDIIFANDIKTNNLMTVRSHPIYKKIELTLYPSVEEAFNKGEYLDILNILIHELSHVYTERLAEVAGRRFLSKEELENEIETCTEELAILLRHLVNTDVEHFIKNLK